MSHTPADPRHTVALAANALAGHAAPVPVHVSATSQIPADPRQTVALATNALTGHVALVPVQVS